MDGVEQAESQLADDLLRNEICHIGASEYADMAVLNEEEENILTEEMADLFLTFD
ncbi:hypothetical protein SCLCIDRAFT_34297 [Scleroderma citrinum Foug A]|uniref:Uncharacterized protein n=1 Tax=Scleroderma citrinum Foug A TaxID=1036808 RepID=A0A0C3D2S0_9AGAM|nr:hypothetical protein SCLCIDRAFT_34297 [Scleroderma citrinum Foug A]